MIQRLMKQHFITYSEITLNDEQKDAVSRALKSKMFLLTGLAGTGKTTVLKAIVDGFKSLIEKNMKEGTKIHDIQVISPQRYDKIGANELNYFIGDAFNKYEGRRY